MHCAASRGVVTGRLPGELARESERVWAAGFGDLGPQHAGGCTLPLLLEWGLIPGYPRPTPRIVRLCPIRKDEEAQAIVPGGAWGVRAFRLQAFGFIS